MMLFIAFLLFGVTFSVPIVIGSIDTALVDDPFAGGEF